MDFFEIMTLILVAGKVFGFCDLTWMQCFAPIWIPILLVACLGLCAWNTAVGVGVTIAVVILTLAG